MKTLMAVLAFFLGVGEGQRTEPVSACGVQCSASAVTCEAGCYPRCQQICAATWPVGSPDWRACSKNCIPQCDTGCVAAMRLCERQQCAEPDAGP